MYKKIIVIGTYLAIFLMLLISTIASSGLSINKNNIVDTKNQNIETSLNEEINDADLPIWKVGDRWIYICYATGGHANDIDFDISIDNMKLEVIEILSESYKLSVSVSKGDITGSASISIEGLVISGSLINTMINGLIYINRSNLAVINSDITLDGYIDKIIDIHFTVDMSTNFYDSGFRNTNFSGLSFPMNIGEFWVSPLVFIISDLNLNLLPQPTTLNFMIDEQLFTCYYWDIVDVGTTEYDALKISRGESSDYVWYSPRAGNIVKIDYNSIDLDFDFVLRGFTINLKSTTYSIQTNPPTTPSDPSGPTLLDVGSSGDYITSSTDPDGDKIRYIFNWGDGTTTESDFYTSDDTATITKTWNKKGNFSVIVKARDKWGGESTWSDALSVRVLNDSPGKAEKPNGPTSGRIKKESYTYETSAIDPNGHKVRYEFDWGDGSKSFTEFVDSGENASATHTWNKKGNFNIKARAEDYYGEKGEWSDPLGVTMPKRKLINITLTFQKLFERFPFLVKILNQIII